MLHMKSKGGYKPRPCDSPYRKTRREKVESELSAIPRMDPALKKLTSADGFADYYLEMCDLYLSQREAYERLEDFHINITGRRRYSEYGSFRKVLERMMANERNKKGALCVSVRPRVKEPEGYFESIPLE